MCKLRDTEGILSRGVPSVLFIGTHTHGDQSYARYVACSNTFFWENETKMYSVQFKNEKAKPFDIQKRVRYFYYQILWADKVGLWGHGEISVVVLLCVHHCLCSFISSDRESCWENPPWVERQHEYPPDVGDPEEPLHGTSLAFKCNVAIIILYIPSLCFSLQTGSQRIIILQRAKVWQQPLWPCNGTNTANAPQEGHWVREVCI